MERRKVFSSRQNCLVWIILFLFLACVIQLSHSVATFAQTADDLAKSANALIRDAERNMHGGKTDQAAKLLEEAQGTLDALTKADPSHRQLKGLETKYAGIKKQFDRKTGGADVKASTPLTPSAPGEAQKPSRERAPAGVSKRITDINRQLDSVERRLAAGTEASAKQADYELKETRGLLDEIDKQYSGQFDAGHPDYVAVKERFAVVEEKAKDALAVAEKKKAGAKESEAAKEKMSAEWVAKFQAYLSYPGNEGHNPDLLVYVPGTSEPEKFGDAQKRYEAFNAFYEDYKKVEFPHGKSEKLETLADRDAPQRLADFERQFAARAGAVAGDAEKQISQAMAHLERDKAWEKDASVKPPLVDKKWLDSIDNLVGKVNTALGSGSPDAARINKSYAALVAKDKEHRKTRADRTFLSPDVYKGEDKEELLKKAGDIVAKERPGSNVLRVSLYKDGWEEKTVEGWTDSTRTKWEKKTFRQINAQVVGKDGSGVHCHTLHLAKDKMTGGWGTLYGHIMFSDPMAEQNVHK